jgi:hypothetical protein
VHILFYGREVTSYPTDRKREWLSILSVRSPFPLAVTARLAKSLSRLRHTALGVG